MQVEPQLVWTKKIRREILWSVEIRFGSGTELKTHISDIFLKKPLNKSSKLLIKLKFYLSGLKN